MTPKDVQVRVDDISRMANDDEMAHSYEDDLHQSVLQAISNGRCNDPQEYAKLALTTLDIKFNRWCA